MYPSKDKTIDFGYGLKYRKFSGIHKGVDFFVPIGTPVYAAVGGKVLHAGSNSSTGWGRAYGIQIIVDNNKFKNGDAGLYAGYMHLSKVNVKPGDTVRKGQLIGWTGNTGRVVGPHLHFEIQKLAHWSSTGHVNPERWLNQ